MLNRFKSALLTAVGGKEGVGGDGGLLDTNSSEMTGSHLPVKFSYSRPSFLQFGTEEEMLVSADHAIRPIIVPRDVNKIPWKSGYAETINAGKSLRNEDQATVHVGIVQKPNPDVDGSTKLNSEAFNALPYVYFALFDGHAGAGASLAASKTLHKILEQKLMEVLDVLVQTWNPDGKQHQKVNERQHMFPEKEITCDALVVGALETAFWEMDRLIEQDRLSYHMLGGCTALVALFFLGKVYVANAGDSRAIICRGEKVIEMSQDFTPETERSRIRKLALVKPQLLGGEYTALEFSRRPVRKDIGQKLLYREPYMNGWAYKLVTVDDLKFPLIYGEGKRSRVLATIGVTRGFGDHDLKAQSSNISIKPFLSPQPEVRIYDISNEELMSNDVLVMGTDGLWDVTANETAAEIVQKTLDHFAFTDDSRYRYRYVSAAQDLVMHSRGKLRERTWKTSNGKPATIDDITVFVIPLLPYKEDFKQWFEARRFMIDNQQSELSNAATVNTMSDDSRS